MEVVTSGIGATRRLVWLGTFLSRESAFASIPEFAEVFFPLTSYMRLNLIPRVQRVLFLECLIIGMALLNSACKSDDKLQKLALTTPAITPEDVFSEADIVSTYVRAETSDAYCNLMVGAAFKEKLIAAVNQLRATEQKCGEQTFPASAPLVWNVKLQRAAYEHSAQMAITN